MPDAVKVCGGNVLRRAWRPSEPDAAGLGSSALVSSALGLICEKNSFSRRSPRIEGNGDVAGSSCGSSERESCEVCDTSIRALRRRGRSSSEGGGVRGLTVWMGES